MSFSKENLEIKLAIGFCVILLIFGVFCCGYIMNDLGAKEEFEIIEVTSESIYIRNNSFYIIGPEGKGVEINPSSVVMFDFTEQSTVYVRFFRKLPNFLFQGTEWKLVGIVKTD